jgi:3-oxoacyl-[acyl-carrier-protein] synthase-3
MTTLSPRSAVILGTGSYTPERIVSNEDFAESLDTSDEWIRTRTGIHQRRFAAPEEATSEMACKAAEAAIAAAGIDRSEIDLIVVATMTPDMPFPSTACLLQSKLGLPNVAAFDLQAACSGFVYGLNVVSGLLLSGRHKKALLVGAEKMSSILDFEDRTTCVLFGDGAGAAVLGVEDCVGKGVIASLSGADGSQPELLQQPGGGSALPPTHASLDQRQHFLKMNGKEIFKLAVRVMGNACKDTLQQAGYSADDLDLVIPHQANMRIIESLQKRLDIDHSKFHNNLHLYGNTSAASVPLALDEAIRAGRIQSGDLILLVAFGAGLTWASTLIKW